MKRRVLLGLLALFLAAGHAIAQKRITAAEAREHIGKKATVCGKVASARYSAASRGQPTFLNLDKPYPNPTFTVVIWGSNRTKFGSPETDYKDKSICVTGAITEYRGSPQIEASDPAQVKIDSEQRKSLAPPAAVPRATESGSSQVQTQDRTVYITRTGKKYHGPNCSSLSRSRIPISLKEAQQKGYTACARCGGR